jgi:hypothetical protein
VGQASGPDGSPWGQGSYETRPCTVGAHSVGEASGPDGSPWGQGSCGSIRDGGGRKEVYASTFQPASNWQNSSKGRGLLK